MAVTTLTSTKGLALKGVMARPAGRHEVLAGATLADDGLLLIYRSCRMEQVSPRKSRMVASQRLVICERRYTAEGDDFWWYGVRQHVTSG